MSTIPAGTPRRVFSVSTRAACYQSEIAIDGALYNSLGGLAVDPAGAGAVYVEANDATTGAGVVVKYSAAGAFVYALDVGSSGRVINGGGVVAVDPVNGTVYATANDPNTGQQVVAAFDGARARSTASFDGSAGSPDGGFVCPGSLAVDAAHELMWSIRARAASTGTTPTGTFAGQRSTTAQVAGPSFVTIDPTSGEVFVAENGPSGPQVTDYGAVSAPSRVYTFGAGVLGGMAGLAVNHGSGTVYVADNAQQLGPALRRVHGADGDRRCGLGHHGHRRDAQRDGRSGGLVRPTITSSTGRTPATARRPAALNAGHGSADVPVTAGSRACSPTRPTTTGSVATNGNGASSVPISRSRPRRRAPTLDGSPAFASDMTATGATLHAHGQSQQLPDDLSLRVRDHHGLRVDRTAARR